MSDHASCRNCGATLTGKFCSNCGQTADVHVPSTKEIVHEALEGITHSDSRIWSTLSALVFKPGKLTLEFIAGRRAAYLPPFRLYLIMSVAFFLVTSFTHFKQQPVVIDTRHDVAHRTQESDCTSDEVNIFGMNKNPYWRQRLQRACVGIVHDNGASLMHAAVTLMSKAMFVLVPVVALLHMLMYWWPRHRYAVHLLFFLHLHAFIFFDGTLWMLLGQAADTWPALETLDSYASTALFLWILAYSVVAMRHVFQMRWLLTLAKALALFIVYITLLGLTLSGVFFYAALQL